MRPEMPRLAGGLPPRKQSRGQVVCFSRLRCVELCSPESIGQRPLWSAANRSPGPWTAKKSAANARMVAVGEVRPTPKPSQRKSRIVKEVSRRQSNARLLPRGKGDESRLKGESEGKKELKIQRCLLSNSALHYPQPVRGFLSPSLSPSFSLTLPVCFPPSSISI